MMLAIKGELAAAVAGFDHATGFGLVRAAQSLDHPPLALGDSNEVREMNTVKKAAPSGPRIGVNNTTASLINWRLYRYNRPT